MEYQIQELVQKLLDGQGLPLIKPLALRRMAGYEKTRVMVLRQLETQLGVRRADGLKMATDSQILPKVYTYRSDQSVQVSSFQRVLLGCNGVMSIIELKMRTPL